ncbi:hypothetical protein QF000_000637 [Paraburkholderia atlantica]|uniref:Phosphatidylglycerol lysyltransferase C-terminal domain-containing protein n=1 Tax=Paraburkholderia youngii TaxID=2782701 RepID=A0A7W8LHR5_9BURK|nr:hypothetical protein [Paraburkholderia youngii]MBB5406076.1 hypothetical protein [Paraburkholderia youngii]
MHFSRIENRLKPKSSENLADPAVLIDDLKARKNIRLITAEEEEIFYKYIGGSINENEKFAFANHWPYIIQATRDRGYVYFSDDKQTRIYWHFRTVKDAIQVVIVNHFGIQSEKMVKTLADSARRRDIITIIKNVNSFEIKKWRNYGFDETIQPWSKYSFRDDNSYPENIYDISRILNFGENRNVNVTTKKIIRKFLRERSIVALPYSDGHQDAARQLLIEYAEYQENQGTDAKEEIIQAHDFIFSKKIKNKIVLTHIEDGIVLAISFLTQVGDVLFFNAIVNKNQSNLMRFLLWQAVEVSYTNHCLTKPIYLALQGSENRGQLGWKTHFYPAFQICKTHLTNA